MTSKWEGKSLVSEGAMKAANGDTTTIREVLSLGADGKTLTMDVTTVGEGEASSTLVYTKITDVGPCETWPTPCKSASGLVVRLFDRDELRLSHDRRKVLRLSSHRRIFGPEVIQLDRPCQLR